MPSSHIHMSNTGRKAELVLLDGRFRTAPSGRRRTEVGRPSSGLPPGLITKLVSGSTTTGAAGGNYMAASEFGEPASVSGSGSMEAAGEAPITFCSQDLLAQAESIGTLPDPAPRPATHLLVETARPRLTGYVTLSDHVAVAFGDAKGLA